jgi:hypothetical protein
MAGFWPLYSNFSSKAEVTLAMPGVPSKILKSIGIDAKTFLMIPNVEFLIAFMEGDVGIADAIVKKAMQKNLNSPIAANDEMVARHFSKVNGLGLEDKMSSFKDASGKLKIPKDEIVPSSENDSLGLKALEKTILQSIFESQKPYIEIAKLVIGVLVDIEDIIARVMPILSISPLTFKSAKPINNKGEGKRPGAIGYQNGAAMKKAVAELDKVSKKGGKLTVNKDGSTSRINDNPGPVEGVDFSKDLSKMLGKSWKVINAVYSTGLYDSNVDYLYTYIDLPADEEKKGDEPEDDKDPLEKYKPKRIIFGMFNSKGVPVDPSTKLKTIGFSGAVETNFKVADWVLKSPKWVFPKSDNPGAIVWPSFGEPIYTWERFLGLDQKNSKKQPDSNDPAPPYKLKKYKKDEKNILNGMDAVEGDPVISGFDSSDIDIYTRYFTEFTTISMNMAKELSEEEKKESIKMIMGQLNVKSHLENLNLYGQSKSPVYKDFTVPEGMKLSFKPMQLTIPEAINDPDLKGLNGKIWIDPETDYEFKIIQVKPTTKIAYSEAKGEPEVQVDIKSFVKNKATFKLSNNKKFGISIKRNNVSLGSFEDVEEYVLENWNYNPETKKILTNDYSMTIWSKTPTGILEGLFANTKKVVMGRGTSFQKHGDYEITITNNDGVYSYLEKEYPATLTTTTTTNSLGTQTKPNFKDGIKKIGDGTLVEVKDKVIVKWYIVYNKSYDILNLPKFGTEYKITYDVNKKVDRDVKVPNSFISNYFEPSESSVPNVIPLYQVKVSNGNFPYGKIIDPSKILNEHLTKDELYSTGRYGSGSADDPQELGTIYRYALTDLDEETYYIIEGIRTTENDGGDRDGKDSSGKSTGGSGGGFYRLPHAIGAITVFIKMLVKIFSKLIPSIMKLLKLFGNPMSFLTDIIIEKLGESFSIFSPEAKKKFEQVQKIVKDKSKYSRPSAPTTPTAPGKPDVKMPPSPNSPNMGDYVRRMKAHFENSPLKNHVAVDSLGSFKDANGKVPKVPSKDAIGNFKSIIDGVGFIPFSIFGKDLSFGIELKMNNIITKEWGNPVPMRLIFNKEKNSKDDGNLKVNGPGKDDGKNKDGKDSTKTERDMNPNSKRNLKQGLTGSLDPNKNYVTLSTWYSTGEFINGVDYKYVYIDQDDEELLKDVDNLTNSIDPEDLNNAKNKLEDALAKNPDNDALKNKLDDVKKKMLDVASNSQPLLKMILGIVTLPVKIIAGIVEWIMNFFKSLTNPMTLPAKMIEFLSFKWIMDFFTPIGIMKMLGIKMDPTMPAEWMAKATMINPNKNLTKEELLKKMDNLKKPSVDSNLTDKTGKAGDLKGKDIKKPNTPNVNTPAADLKAESLNKTAEIPKDVPLHKGAYAMPDDFALADLSKFFSVAFLAQLPTYSTKDMREQGKTIPKRLFSPIICFIEKLINGIIDFVWSVLGIEAIIPPPHIKLCSSDDPEKMDPNELAKIVNGGNTGPTASTPADIDIKTDILATDPNPSVQSPPLERYVYEVKLPDGKTKRFRDKEKLDKYIEENSDDIGFDFQF